MAMNLLQSAHPGSLFVRALNTIFKTSLKSIFKTPFKTTGVLTMSVLIASCVNDPAARTQAGSDEECVYVRVTGSNLPVKECRSRAEREALAASEREASEELFRQNQALDETGAQSLGADSLD